MAGDKPSIVETILEQLWELRAKIEENRYMLNCMVRERGGIDNEVLSASQQLDELIVEYHRIYLLIFPDNAIQRQSWR